MADAMQLPLILTDIIHEEWRINEFLSKTEHVVTRAEFVFMPSLISKQLVRAKGGV